MNPPAPASPFVALQHRNFRLLWTGQLVSMALVGVTTCLGLWLAGIPMPLGLGLLSGASWKRRAALWGGGVAVALAAILFAKASDLAFSLFRGMLAHSRYWALLATRR